MTWNLARSAAYLGAWTCLVLPLAVAPPAAANNGPCPDPTITGRRCGANGDTHITGVGLERTIDCNNAVLLVNGANNIVTAKGVCWGVTVQGSGHTIVADTIIDNVIVYGWDQTVLFHNGAPRIWDRGRELGMTNRISWTPA